MLCCLAQVAVDGSHMSDRAMAVAGNLVNRESCAVLTCHLHIATSNAPAIMLAVWKGHALLHAIAAKRGDKLYILHVSDSNKTYLPRHLQPQHLKNYYQGMRAEISL